jgi:hypothetical protein
LILLAGCSVEEVPADRTMSVNSICVPQARWPEIVQAMSASGRERGMQVFGGFDDPPTDRALNVALIRGHNPFGTDDLDLWFVSDPGKRDRVNFIELSRTRLSSADAAMARSLLAEVAKLKCATDGG